VELSAKLHSVLSNIKININRLGVLTFKYISLIHYPICVCDRSKQWTPSLPSSIQETDGITIPSRTSVSSLPSFKITSRRFPSNFYLFIIHFIFFIQLPKKCGSHGFPTFSFIVFVITMSLLLDISISMILVRVCKI